MDSRRYRVDDDQCPALKQVLLESTQCKVVLEDDRENDCGCLRKQMELGDHVDQGQGSHNRPAAAIDVEAVTINMMTGERAMHVLARKRNKER